MTAADPAFSGPGPVTEPTADVQVAAVTGRPTYGTDAFPGPIWHDRRVIAHVRVTG